MTAPSGGSLQKMSPNAAPAGLDRASLLRHKEDLLVPASELEERLAFLRSGYERAGAGTP